MTNAFFLLSSSFILISSSFFLHPFSFVLLLSSFFVPPPSFVLQDAGHQVDNTGSTEARHDKLRSLMKQDAFDINKVRLNNLLTSVNNILTMMNRTTPYSTSTRPVSLFSNSVFHGVHSRVSSSTSNSSNAESNLKCVI